MGTKTFLMAGAALALLAAGSAHAQTAEAAKDDVLELDALDPLGADLLEEVGVSDHSRLRGRTVELLEDGEQHQRDHHPDSHFREPLIVHRISMFGP